MKKYYLGALAMPALLFGACAEGETPYDGPSFEFAVAPLQLDGIGEACYDVRVENGATPKQIVVALEDICSGQYGNGAGGSIAYVAPCDADEGVSLNTVTIWPTLLDDQGALLSDWQNPCGESGCSLEVQCVENKDTFVEFNLTIMRDAKQGFFDIAVNFNDIFCSAKFDSCYDVDPADPIELLFGQNGDRGHTAIAALACTASPNSQEGTVIAAIEPKLECSNPAGEGKVSVTIPLNDVAEGNASVTLGGAIIGYAVYFGEEELNCGEPAAEPVSCNKVYYNIAISLADLEAAELVDCTLSYGATAFGENDDIEALIATTYPYITYNASLTDKLGQPECFEHPLNGTNSGVTTAYLGEESDPDLSEACTTDGTGPMECEEKRADDP